MTEKRFEQYIIPGDIRDKATGMVYQCRTGNQGKSLCNLLNNLHEYNLDLHGEIKLIKQEKREQHDIINRLIHLCAEHNLNWQNEVEQ